MSSRRLAVDDPVPLRDGRLEELRRERPQQPARQPALALDDAQGVAPLALRPLPEHLAGEDEVRPLGLHDLLRLAHHEDAAVDARVGVRAVAVLGVDEHVEVARPRDVDVLDVHLEIGGGAERLVARHGAVGAAALPALRLRDAEPRVEVDRLHLDALPAHERERERRVEPSRDHRDRLALPSTSSPSAAFRTKLFQAAPSWKVPRCSLRVALHHIGMSCAMPGSVAMTSSTAPGVELLHRLRRLDDRERAETPRRVDGAHGCGHVGLRHAHSFSPSARAGQRRASPSPAPCPLQGAGATLVAMRLHRSRPSPPRLAARPVARPGQRSSPGPSRPHRHLLARGRSASSASTIAGRRASCELETTRRLEISRGAGSARSSAAAFGLAPDGHVALRPGVRFALPGSRSSCAPRSTQRTRATRTSAGAGSSSASPASCASRACSGCTPRSTPARRSRRTPGCRSSSAPARPSASDRAMARHRKHAAGSRRTSGDP